MTTGTPQSKVNLLKVASSSSEGPEGASIMTKND